MAGFEALLYGLVQGVGEYLPISSSAHLILLPRFLKTEDPGIAFDVFLHFGTLLATLAYFWREWASFLSVLTKNTPGAPPKPFLSRISDTSASGISLLHLIVATFPALIIGGLAHKLIDQYFRSNVTIAAALFVGGGLLVYFDRRVTRETDLNSLTIKGAFTIGLFQCLSLVSGFSRSGATLIGGRFLGLNRSAAAKMSFLMSAPVTAAAIVFEFRHYKELLHGSVGATGLLVGGFSAFFFGAIAIGGLMKLIKTRGFGVFFAYRAILAAVIIFVLD